MSDTGADNPAARLVAAIKSLEGWYYLIENADDYGGQWPGVRTTGSVLASLLLAAGESAEPLLVTGRLDDTQSGGILVVYRDFFVQVSVSHLREESASHKTAVRFFTEVSDLQIETRRSYFDGTDAYPLARGFSFSFLIDGDRQRLAPSGWGYVRDPLTGDEAVYAAFQAIRDRLAKR